MAVRPRGKGYQADITVKGRRYRETFDTEAAAQAWELEARAAILRGDPIPRANAPQEGTSPDAQQSDRGNNTLGAILDRTFHRFWKGGASEKTMLIYMKQLETYFGAATPIHQVDANAIDGFIDFQISQNQSNGSINRKLACLSKALTYAFERKIIAHKPKIERKKEGVTRIRWLSVEEEKALLGLFRSWEKEEHAEVVEVLIDTGLRPKELYSLVSRDVDLKSGTITIWKNKTDHPRTIYMTKRVKDIVSRRMSAVTAPSQKLFPYNNAWLRHTWDRAKLQLGLMHDKNFIPYICRHTCASRLVQRGVAINVVKEWLGHKSIQMTMRYAILAPHNLKAAATVLEAAE